jgi:acetyltransferase-like isoleucine patch superfamily enzyme
VVIGDNTSIGDGTRVGSFCDIGRDVVIGKNCNIQAHATISSSCIIGDNVFIAPNSSLLNDKYPKSDLLTPPQVRDNAVVGGGATILPGVVIGESSVVAAGSVVTRNVQPRTVVVGAPAKAVMTVGDYENKRDKFIKAWRQVEE